MSIAACLTVGVGVGFLSLSHFSEIDEIGFIKKPKRPEPSSTVLGSSQHADRERELAAAIVQQEKRSKVASEEAVSANEKKRLEMVADETRHRQAVGAKAEAPSSPKPSVRGFSENGQQVTTNGSILDRKSQGAVGGRVLNATTGQYLAGAEVAVDGTGQRVISDEFGSFALDKLPPGKQTITVTYPGLEPKKETVDVSSGKPTDVALGGDSGEVVALGEFRVTSAKEGAAMAINEQRFSAPRPAAAVPAAPPAAKDSDAGAKQKAGAEADEGTLLLDSFAVTSARHRNAQAIAVQEAAPNLKTVVAADAFGEVAEGNAGEFLKHLPAKETDYGKRDDRPVISSDQIADINMATQPVENSATKEPVSTFSLHVSDVSFKILQNALANDSSAEFSQIRPEEVYNAFNYGDPSPALNEKIACRIEQSAHPYVQQRNLVRIAMKVAAAGRGASQPLHLTLLLDTSGSMEREDRRAAVRGAMKSLISLLGPNDRVTLIGFARQPRLLVENVAGNEAGQLLDILASTPSEGGTNFEEALKLGYELAARQFDEKAQNRIVLLTDGAANLGNADRAQLSASVEEMRKEGIAFDACGVGLEGLDDGMLEALTRKGDGRYYVLNSDEEADAGFARQLAGALRPAAKNVKVQVRFNPARVGQYRLIGFEQHRLREEDFRNDKVDAAELAADEAAVAVYQIEPLPQGEGDLGEVYVRFLDVATGTMVERSWTLPYDAKASAFDRASPTMQLAGASALLADAAHNKSEEECERLKELIPVVSGLRTHFPNQERVEVLISLFEKLR